MKTLEKPKVRPQADSIKITERNKRKLEAMIEEIRRSGKNEDNLESLVTELNRAEVVRSEVIPRNCVTMGSTVSIIDRDTSERMKFELVYPDQADVEANRISVLSPIGASVLGSHVGDEFEWEEPARIRRFVVAKVDFQLEATNTYRL